MPRPLDAIKKRARRGPRYGSPFAKKGKKRNAEPGGTPKGEKIDKTHWRKLDLILKQNASTKCNGWTAGMTTINNWDKGGAGDESGQERKGALAR